MSDDEKDTSAVTSTSEDDADDSSKRVQLTNAEFADIRNRYELGTDNLGDLADEYGVSRQALSARFKRHGVKKGSRVNESAEKEQQEIDAAGKKFAVNRDKWIEETRQAAFKTTGFLRMNLLKVMSEAKTAGKSFASIDEDVKALVRIQKSIIEGFDFQLHRVLNADDNIDDDLIPDLKIDELTVEDLTDHHVNISGDLNADRDEISDEVADVLSEIENLLKEK